MGLEEPMQQHPMPEFGSFSLLLALALSAYTLVMGGLALWQSKAGGGGRLGEATLPFTVSLPCFDFRGGKVNQDQHSIRTPNGPAPSRGV